MANINSIYNLDTQSAQTTNGGYSKILAIFNKQQGNNGPTSRAHSTQIILKDTLSYEQALAQVDKPLYQTHAGTDLSSIFMPFCSLAGSGEMPSFHKSAIDHPTGTDPTQPSGSPIKNYKILPFKWEKTNNTIVYDRALSPSGDSLGYTVSDTEYRGDVDRYRDPSYIRSIGFRLPMMGVGWGYTTGGQPFPSGTTKGKFKGDFTDGTQVNPCDYIAAPIDFRYDPTRNVFTCAAGFWGEITGLENGTGTDFGNVSGVAYYSWREKKFNASGTLINVDSSEEGQHGKKGEIPALEVNRNRAVPSGTNVWITPSNRTDLIAFSYSNAGQLRAIVINTSANGLGIVQIKLLVRNSVVFDTAASYDPSTYFTPSEPIKLAVNDAQRLSPDPLLQDGDYVWVSPETELLGIDYKINGILSGCGI